jgi:hypothetical protein
MRQARWTDSRFSRISTSASWRLADLRAGIRSLRHSADVGPFAPGTGRGVILRREDVADDNGVAGAAHALGPPTPAGR